MKNMFVCANHNKSSDCRHILTKIGKKTNSFLE